MSLPDKTTVLIVGAGPAGLATALSLLHHGLQDFVIVDATPQGVKSFSRAVVVHAATLEALDTIGCGDDMVSQGTRTTAFNIESRTEKLFSPNIESLRPYTRHPCVLIISQNVTERILEKKLEGSGVTIHRSLKVAGLRRNADDPILSDVALEDGRVITAKYVIGADGAHSVIRDVAGIGFSDPVTVMGEENNNLTQMVLADVTFDNIGADDSASVTLTPDSLFLCFPLPPSFNESLAASGQISTFERIYRIGCGVPLAQGEIPHAPSKEYLQNLVDRFGPNRLASDPSVNPSFKPTCIKDLVWCSRFRNHASIADAAFTHLGSGEMGEGGVVLLIGDAAHLHSPAGGQGMNLGLRDGIFLGEALTKHIHAAGSVSPSEADAILRKFAAGRHARALEVIMLTKRILAVSGMKHRKQIAWWLPIDSETARDWALWVLGRIPYVRKRMAWELSGLGRR